jgi:hypothetical protein
MTVIYKPTLPDCYISEPPTPPEPLEVSTEIDDIVRRVFVHYLQFNTALQWQHDAAMWMAEVRSCLYEVKGGGAVSRVFDLTDTGRPSEATMRQVRFLRAFLFGNARTDTAWLDSANALMALLAQELMKSDDPVASLTNAIEMLRFALERCGVKP